MTDNVATAAARARGAKARHTGAAAANALGLSVQVPARATYITDGPSQEIDLDGRRIVLKQVSAKRLAIAPGASTIIEALRYLGHEGVEQLKEADIRRIARALDDQDARDLTAAQRNAPDWMRSTIEEILDAHQLHDARR